MAPQRLDPTLTRSNSSSTMNNTATYAISRRRASTSSLSSSLNVTNKNRRPIRTRYSLDGDTITGKKSLVQGHVVDDDTEATDGSSSTHGPIMSTPNTNARDQMRRRESFKVFPTSISSHRKSKIMESIPQLGNKLHFEKQLQGQLFGRENEIQQLKDAWKQLLLTTEYAAANQDQGEEERKVVPPPSSSQQQQEQQQQLEKGQAHKEITTDTTEVGGEDRSNSSRLPTSQSDTSLASLNSLEENLIRTRRRTATTASVHQQQANNNENTARNILQRPLKGKRQLVTIAGYSGTGKTALASSLRNDVEVRTGGMFCTGKYDHHMNHESSSSEVEPLLGIVTACQEVCSKILEYQLSHGDTSLVFRIRSQLVQSIRNRDEYQLLQALVVGGILPELLDILKIRPSSSSSSQQRFEPEVEDFLLAQEASDKEGDDGRQIHRRKLGGNTRETKKSETLCDAFVMFFRIVLSSFNDPDQTVVLLLDDLQWADAISIQIIKRLLLAEQLHGLMIVGCYRSNEVDLHTHPLSKVLRELQEEAHDPDGNAPVCALGVTKIHVGSLSVEGLTSMFRVLLSKDQESDLASVQELAKLVHDRTAGNIFFIKAFLVMLVEEGFMKFHIGSFQWDWNISMIQDETSATPNLLDMIRTRMLKFDDGVLRLLKIATCLGNRFDRDLLQLAWSNMGSEEESPPLLPDQCCKQSNTDQCKQQSTDDRFMVSLEQSIREGCLRTTSIMTDTESMLDAINGSSNLTLRFIHDKIRECLESLMSDEEFRTMKARVGSILFEKLSKEGIESHLFTVVNLLNCGPVKQGNCRNQAVQIASMNFQAGLKAKDMANFSAALQFANSGIERLLAWDLLADENHLQFSIKLQTLVAQAKYGLAEDEQAAEICRHILQQKAIPAIQKCPAVKVLLDILHSQDKDEALDLCLDFLKELGCEFPKQKLIRKALVAPYVRETKASFIPTVEELKSMPRVTDPVILETLTLLETAGSAAYLGDSDLYVLIRCRFVRLIKKHGLTDDSASCFASLANVLCHKNGDFATGRRLAELSLAAQDVLQDNYNKARTIVTAYGYSLSWVLPVRSCLKKLLEAYEVGLQAGNKFSATTATMFYLNYAFFAGIKLPFLLKDYGVYIKQMEDLNMPVPIALSTPAGQLAENLVGNSNGHTTLLKGSLMDEEESMARWEANGNKMFTLWVPRWKVMACMFFGEYVKGADITIELGGVSVAKKSLSGATCGQEFLAFGLCCYATARILKKKAPPKYRKMADQVRSEVKTMVKIGCVNLVHVLHCLEAEMHALAGKEDKARSCYERAIVDATRGGFLQDAAVASERYGMYLLEQQQQSSTLSTTSTVTTTHGSNMDGSIGDNGNIIIDQRNLDAVQRINDAIQYYTEWGANRKVELMQVELNTVLLAPSHSSFSSRSGSSLWSIGE